MLHIRLFGTPHIKLDGDLIQINRRATRVLLFYLAASEGSVTRPQLYMILWQEGADRELRKKLRVTLNNLRKALPQKDILTTYLDTVRLNRENVYVDLDEFSSVLKRIRPYVDNWQDGQSFPTDLYQASVKAAGLWNDARYFIDSDDLEETSSNAAEWRAGRNAELMRDRITLYNFLSRLEDSFGREEKAALWAQEALKLDKFDEDAIFLHLRSLLRANQRAEALHYYRSIEDFVPDLYGKFSAEIRRMGEELTQKKYVPPEKIPYEWDTHPSLQAPFVGQEKALENLRSGYRKGKAVLVVGEAGAGKTRLVKEFYQEVKDTHRLLSLTCLPSGENLPYQPWIDMLRREIKAEFLRDSHDARLTPLTMLLPESASPEKTVPSYATPFVFDAIKHLLLLLAEKTPIILFVDNAQWADDATLDSLTYLIEQSFFKQQELSLIITSRVGEKNKDIENFFLTPLQPQTERVEVSRLSQKDISDLAFFIFQENLPPEVAARLLRTTGGNPFFVLEMLSAYGGQVESGTLDFQIPVPESVKGLINIRLEKLQSRTKALLLLAAIHGDPFDFEVLQKAAALPIDHMIEIAKELEKAQLIRTADKEHSKHTFVHEIIRETLIASLPPLQKRALHKKIAQALSEVKGKQDNDHAAILAEHYEKAREYAAAFSQWIQAGKYAYKLYSLSDAVAAYQRAEALIPKVELPNEVVYELYVPWGIMLFEMDKPDELEKVMQRFLDIGEERNCNLLIGAALDGFSDVYMARNQFEEGLKYTQKALNHLKASKKATAQMSALIHHGVFLYMRTHFADAQESIHEALKLGEDKEDLLSLYFYGHALYQKATILTGMGRLREASDYAEKSLIAMRRSRSPHGVILPYSITGLIKYYLVELDEGLRSSLRAIELSERTKSWRMLGYSYAYAGLNYTGLALLDKAWEYAEKAIDIGTTHGHTEITALGYKIMGDIYVHLDAFTQAKDVYSQGVSVDPNGFGGLENRARRAVTLGLLGDPETESELNIAIAQTEAVGLTLLSVSAETLALSIYVLSGDYETFEEKAAAVKGKLKQMTHPDAQLWIDYLRALSYLRRGEMQYSAELFEEFFEKYTEKPFIWIYLHALRFYIVVLNQLGRDASRQKEKLEHILQKIENSIGDAPLRDEWKTLTEKIRSV